MHASRVYTSMRTNDMIRAGNVSGPPGLCVVPVPQDDPNSQRNAVASMFTLSWTMPLSHTPELSPARKRCYGQLLSVKTVYITVFLV